MKTGVTRLTLLSKRIFIKRSNQVETETHKCHTKCTFLVNCRSHVMWCSIAVAICECNSMNWSLHPILHRTDVTVVSISNRHRTLRATNKQPTTTTSTTLKSKFHFMFTKWTNEVYSCANSHFVVHSIQFMHRCTSLPRSPPSFCCRLLSLYYFAFGISHIRCIRVCVLTGENDVTQKWKRNKNEILHK